jgi:hypothetical protein
LSKKFKDSIVLQCATDWHTQECPKAIDIPLKLECRYYYKNINLRREEV